MTGSALPEIRLDRSDRDTLLRALLEHLADAPGVADEPPFAKLLADPGDWVVALCSAWASVLESLDFYNERVLNDVFLATATDPAAVVRLYHSLGHEFPPHTTATTHVSYVVRDTVAGVDAVTRARRSGTGATADHRARPGGAGSPTAPGPPGGAGSPTVPGPPGVATAVPAGALVQGVAQPDQVPPVFSTLAALDAYVGASKLTAWLPPAGVTPLVTAGTTQLELAGAATGLAPGQPVVVAGRDPATGAPVYWARRLTSVQSDAKRDATRIGWADPLDPTVAAAAPVAEPVVYGFPTGTALFGATAAAWPGLRLAVQLAQPTVTGGPVPLVGGLVASGDAGATWAPAPGGLPPDAVPTAVAVVDGLTLAGTETGVQVADGPPGFRAGVGLPRRPVLSVGGTAARLLAGTAAGAVYESVDRGRTWDAVTGGTPVIEHPSQKRAGGGRTALDDIARVAETRVAGSAVTPPPPPPAPPARIVQHKLPGAAVHGVVPARDGLVAGTDQGAFRYTGRDWLPDGLTEAVLALLQTEAGVYAGTPNGVRQRTEPGSWSPVGTLSTPVLALAAVAGTLVAGTGTGVRVQVGREWLERNGHGDQALPRGAAVTALAGTGSVVVAAVTTGGLYRSTDLGSTWARCDAQHLFDVAASALPERQGPVPPALATAFDGQGLPLPAGTTMSGTSGDWTLTVGARTYHLVSDGTQARVLLVSAYARVNALAAAGGTLLAAVEPGGAAATEWPAYGVSGSTVDLAKVVRSVAPGTLAVVDAGAAPALATVPVTGVEQPSVTAFGQTGTATRLQLGAALPGGTFPRRATTVWTGGQSLALFRAPAPGTPVVRGDRLALATAPAAPLPAGRGGVLTGQPVALAVAPLGGAVELRGGVLRPAPLYELDVRDVAVSPAGAVVLATTEGLVLLPAGSADPVAVTGGPPGDVRAVVAAGPGVLAATATGVWQVDLGSAAPAWRAAGLTGDVVALAADGTLVVARTSDGALWAASPGGTVWRSVPARPGVRTVAVSGGTVWAATAAGVATWSGGSDTWRGTGDTAPAGATALAVDATGTVWAATATGLWSQPAEASGWQRDPSAALDGPVLTVGTDLAGAPVAVTAAAVLTGGPGGWSAQPLPPPAAPVALAAAPDGTLWTGLASRATVVLPHGGVTAVADELVLTSAPLAAADLATLDQQGVPATVTAALAEHGHPLDPATLRVTSLVPGQCWSVRSGTDRYVAARRTDGSTTWVAVYRAAATAYATGRPTRRGETEHWPVEVAGQQGTLAAPAESVLVLPAGTAAPTLAELVTVAGVETRPHDPAPATLRLAAPLEHVYDAATVTVQLNVVPAAQGRPVSTPIGSGNPAVAHQSFPVPLPVAAVPGPDGGPPQSTLQVTVAGTPWTEVRSLHTAGPADLVYQVEHGPDGSAVVQFGDGRHGARLPAGHDNVVASFLTGGGADSEAAPGALVQPLTRPQLVTGVANPVAALRPAAVAPRRAVAASTATLGRAVSLDDLATLAAAQPGVASAAADLVLAASGREVVVTVARAADAPADVVPRVAAVLVAAAAVGLRVQVLAAAVVPVQLTVDVVAPGVRLDVVRAAVTRVKAARPGAALLASDVVAAAVAVPGVAAARVVGWGRSAPTDREVALPARAARWSAARGAEPAELLVADTRPGAVVVQLDPTVTGGA